MPALIIASTSPGAGKTSVAAGLAAHLGRDGRKVFLAKAWSSSPKDDRDMSTFRALLPHTPPGFEPDRAGQGVAQVRQLASRIQAAARGTTVSVLEGVAGDHAANFALADALDGLVILVAKMGDDIVPAAKQYRARLLGVVMNSMPRYKSHALDAEVAPALRQAGVRLLGAIPEDRRLIAPTLALVAEHLGAQVSVMPENAGRLIDNFLIGGLVLDWGPTYFGAQENVGVVVRGDRPDVQIAALQTDTVRAMVMPKGISPIEYVHYEATQRGIPVAVSPFDTHETALRLESLLPKVRFDHPEKLMRMADLIESRMDLAAVKRAVAQPATR
jgi:BioD-like phosphotransacetylase family protein